MKFVVDFTGEIECRNWKDAEQKMLVILKELDKHFEEFDLSLEEKKVMNDVLYE